jgi:hypothetical protein
VFAHKFNERRSVRFPILWETLEIFEDCVESSPCKYSDSVFGVLVEISVKYSLVHEISVAPDVEQDPSQVVKP